jgi:hypothetical protein
MRIRVSPVAGLAMIAVLFLADASRADDSANVQMGLDKTVDVEVSDSIVQVFKILQQQTGVKFVIPESTLALLPYGEQTRLAVTLKRVTLRKALSPMLAGQALQWSVEGDAVEIQPKEALYRLGRRATYDELRMLGLIYTTALQDSKTGGDAMTQLQKTTGDRALRLVLPAGADNMERIAATEKSLPCLASDWLDSICQGRGWTWYLAGDDINVIEMKLQVERQLQRPVLLQYQDAQLMKVIVELARQGRLHLTIEPGVMDYLPAEVKENFSLKMNASISDAFEVISAATGLRFVRTGDGIRVEASEALKRKAEASTSQPAARRRTPFFLLVNIPGPDGHDLQLFLNADELPADVVEAIQAQKNLYVEKLRATLPKAPATQPATAPAATPVMGD